MGSFSAEFKWISPSPNAHDKDGDSRHAISITRGIVTDIFSPRIPVGKRIKIIGRQSLGSDFSLAFYITW